MIITLPAGQKRVTPEQIEKNIGISKDYNNFELRSALVEKDILKANKIINLLEPIAMASILTIVTAYLVDNSYNPFLYFRF